MRRWFGLLAGSLMLVLGACSSEAGETQPRPSTPPSDNVGTADGGGIADDPDTAEEGDVGMAEANDAVPSGVDLQFETVEVDLHDGEYPASVVAPVGWAQDDFMGVSFEQPQGADSEELATFEVETGCQGACEPTDWEALLNGPEGILPQPDDDTEVVERRETPGSAGVVLITEESSGTKVLVVRWDDSADRYFQCESTVERDDLVPAFEAACLASRPDWFPVG